MGLSEKIDEINKLGEDAGRLKERVDILSFIQGAVDTLSQLKGKYPEGTLARSELDTKVEILSYVFHHIKGRSMP